MHFSRLIAVRAATGATLTLCLLLVGTQMLTPESATFKTVYAATLTPFPTPAAQAGGSTFGTPTPALPITSRVQPSPIASPVATTSAVNPVPLATTNPVPVATASPAVGATGSAGSPSQAASDQIASVAAQVAQIAQDPSTTVDQKTSQISALANQFNQLVAVWQQQAQAAGAQAPASTVSQTVSPVPVAPQSGSTPTVPAPAGSGG
jgi:HAMP domain-containing protein